jgi:hypothetical protein
LLHDLEDDSDGETVVSDGYKRMEEGHQLQEEEDERLLLFLRLCILLK